MLPDILQIILHQVTTPLDPDPGIGEGIFQVDILGDIAAADDTDNSFLHTDSPFFIWFLTKA